MEKQITPELNFYKVDKQFLSYLHNEDKKANGFSCVPMMDYSAEQKEKFMCGIIVSVNGIKYLAPVSSYTIKKSNNVLLYSDGGKVTSSIRLNFMFPVANGTYKRYEFEKETDLKYLSVVKQEWLSANQQRDYIRKLAKSTYLEVRRFTAKGKAPKWACNFTYLEQLCKEWEKSVYSELDSEDTKTSDKQVQQVGQARQAEQVQEKNTKEKLSEKDEELISRIRKSPKGAEFDKLFTGREKGEQAGTRLLHLLAFFTDQNPEQMARIYKASELYDPAKGESYLNGIISKSLTPYNQKQSGNECGRSRLHDKPDGKEK